jgi:hypothetical protein
MWPMSHYRIVPYLLGMNFTCWSTIQLPYYNTLSRISLPAVTFSLTHTCNCFNDAHGGSIWLNQADMAAHTLFNRCFIICGSLRCAVINCHTAKWKIQHVQVKHLGPNWHTDMNPEKISHPLTCTLDPGGSLFDDSGEGGWGGSLPRAAAGHLRLLPRVSAGRVAGIQWWTAVLLLELCGIALPLAEWIPKSCTAVQLLYIDMYRGSRSSLPNFRPTHSISPCSTDTIVPWSTSVSINYCCLYAIEFFPVHQSPRTFQRSRNWIRCTRVPKLQPPFLHAFSH